MIRRAPILVLLLVLLSACGDPSSTPKTACGDGRRDSGEGCDDGNLVDGDGCDASCAIELGFSCDGEPSVCVTRCGDGVAAGAEACDDRDLVDGDGCDASCEPEQGWSCGGVPSRCEPGCGDGAIHGAEACDDGNTAAGDGCDGSCRLEAGYACHSVPSVCETICGDGIAAGVEACDDGNRDLGDGCDRACEVELGFDCASGACALTGTVARVVLGGEGGCLITPEDELGCFGRNTQGEVGDGTTEIEVYLPARVLEGVRDLAAGGQHRCALTGDGKVLCWGDNAHAQLGPNQAAPEDSPSPVEVPGLEGAAKIFAGANHSCVLTTAGEVLCWGDNDNGQLGLVGGDDPNPTPIAMPDGLPAVDLGLGEDHSCAVLADGTVACWGDDDNGQLGDGAIGADRSDAARVPTLSGVVDVEAGQDHTCAVTDDGELYCWGDNIDGQLADGSTSDAPTPSLVSLPAAVDRFSLGEQFTCALLVTDEVYCFGEGEHFQLGNGSWVDAVDPTPVQGLPAGDLVDVELGQQFACVLTSEGGRHCWGDGEHGQLGLGPRNRLDPVPVTFSEPPVELVHSPGEYRGVICAVLADGKVECAGTGRLVSSIVADVPGLFEPTRHHLAQPTALASLADVWTMRIGEDFACAATSTAVLCWGDNSQLQLGQGSPNTADVLVPSPVVGLGAVDELRTGGRFACARVGGDVRCWGDNRHLQTGEALTTADQSTPVTVPGLTDAASIALGGAHACALRQSGVVSCWGRGAHGQLGGGTNDDSATPVNVVGLPVPASQVVAGQNHACALAEGEVYCWGDAAYGNLGQGDQVDSNVAVRVPGLEGIVEIASGWNFVCARDAAGQAWCWGYSLDGQLGDGGEELTDVDRQLSPVPFAFDTSILGVTLGNSATCVETATGHRCVGFVSSGQLGDGSTLTPVFPTAPRGL